MTSRKTSFFLYLMPSDLQETALVTVAGGRGAPVSSLCPSWVMYLRDQKINKHWGETEEKEKEINCLRWRVPRKHQRRTETVMVIVLQLSEEHWGGESRVCLLQKPQDWKFEWSLVVLLLGNMLLLTYRYEKTTAVTQSNLLTVFYTCQKAQLTVREISTHKINHDFDIWLNWLLGKIDQKVYLGY